ncbi:MAG: BACON domain-containing protein, partial [Bacteroidales bacterium]|nr:BACON domain-containing protein [Bacteroidales bacterium]
MKLFSITGIVCTLIVSVTLTSCKKAPYISLNTPSAIEFAFNGGQGEIVFSTNRPWSASNTGDWCTLPQTSGEGGECSIPLIISPNPDFDPRRCTVSVSTEAGSF